MKPGVDQARTQSKDGASVWRRQGAPGAGGRQRLSPGSPRLPTPAPHREGWSSPPPWPGCPAWGPVLVATRASGSEPSVLGEWRRAQPASGQPTFHGGVGVRAVGKHHVHIFQL